VKKSFGKDCIEREHTGKQNRSCAENRSGSYGHDGKGENSVGRQFQEVQYTVFTAPRVPLGPFDGDSDLPKAYPTAQSTQVAVMFGHALPMFNDSAGDQR